MKMHTHFWGLLVTHNLLECVMIFLKLGFTMVKVIPELKLDNEGVKILNEPQRMHSNLI